MTAIAHRQTADFHCSIHKLRSVFTVPLFIVQHKGICFFSPQKKGKNTGTVRDHAVLYKISWIDYFLARALAICLSAFSTALR